MESNNKNVIMRIISVYIYNKAAKSRYLFGIVKVTNYSCDLDVVEGKV